MDGISWNERKNQKLIVERGISFENVIEAINNHQYILTPHPNLKYKHQHIIYFEFKNYFYACPFVFSDQGMFLKTIYPSRKAKKIIKETK